MVLSPVDMPGILGGRVDDADFDAMAAPMHHEQWYERDHVGTDGVELGVVHHGDRDPESDMHWQGTDAAGVLHGVVTGGPFEELTPETLFRGILDRPSETLAGLDGLFSLACTDGDRTVLATDKHGSRPCYYTPEGSMRFAAELKALVPVIDDPSVDPRALSDLLAFGYVWGSTTLLDQVSELRPAHALVAENGHRSVERYWDPGHELVDSPDYAAQIQRAYRRSVDAMAETVDGRTGLWLSGGLDSRILASTFDEADHSFSAMTYAIPGERELGPATQVASAFDVDHDRITLGPASAYAARLDRAIGLSDGMIAWSYLINAVHVLDELADAADVTFEAAPQDTYMGHDLWVHDARELQRETVTERLLDRYGKLDPDECRRLLNDRVPDPAASLREEAAISTADSAENAFRDVVWRALAYSHFRSSAVQRSQVGTRVPCASTEFLETAAQRPSEYNRRSVPLSGGRVPMATTRLKFELVRDLDDGMADITYGLSGLPPSFPQWAHVLGMGVQELSDRFGSSTPDHPALIGEWYRTDPAMNSYVNALLEAAAERPEYNAGALRTLQQEHQSGRANNIHPISAITTAESWRQQYLE